MKLTIHCRVPVQRWLLLVLGTMPMQALAQTPESMPTMPALPVIVDTPGQLPEPTPVPRDGPERFVQPERSNSFGEKAPSDAQTPTTMTRPPSLHIPESAPPRTVAGYGQLALPPLDPFRRSFHPSEQHAVSQVEIAAATIKADEANMERRRTAIRYLGNIDCTFNPEAETGLLNALRNDRHESIRYEAALALSNSCCWTKKTIEALNQAAAGSSTDGCPSERSDRVRWASWQALSRYAAAVNPQQMKELPAPVSTPYIHRTAADVPTTHTTSCYFPPGPANPLKTGSARNVDVGPLPPLRPLAPVPEMEPQAPTYEPTPLQQPMKR